MCLIGYTILFGGGACRVMPIYEQYESYCLERRTNELSKIIGCYR